jgi:hypothetical protein
MARFEPLGEKSRKDLALDLLEAGSPGDVLTYDDLAGKVGTHSRPAIQAAVREAAPSFLRSRGHAIENIPGEGYRIVEPDGHIRISEKRRERSSRELEKAHDVVVYVDESEMSPDARKVTEGLRSVLSAQMDFNRRMDARLRSNERATAAVASRAERTEDEVRKLRERMERLEQRGA